MQVLSIKKIVSEHFLSRHIFILLRERDFVSVPATQFPSEFVYHLVSRRSYLTPKTFRYIVNRVNRYPGWRSFFHPFQGRLRNRALRYPHLQVRFWSRHFLGRAVWRATSISEELDYPDLQTFIRTYLFYMPDRGPACRLWIVKQSSLTNNWAS